MRNGFIDYKGLAKQIAKVRPKLLVAGASAYPRAIDFEKLAEIAHGYGAMLMVDMAHIAGLVAGGQHQNPVPYADVVTTTTHKTLRGPRGGLILTNNEYLAKRINSAIFPGTQGGPLEHGHRRQGSLLRRGPSSPSSRTTPRRSWTTPRALAAALTARGVKLVSGGTDNHLMLIDPAGRGVHRQGAGAQPGRGAHHRQQEHRPRREAAAPLSPAVCASAPRRSPPAVWAPEEMKVIADCIADCIFDFEDKKADVAARVAALVEKFPLYQ